MEVWTLNELERHENMNTKLNKILTAFLTALMALVILTGCSQDSGGSADKPKKDYSNIEMNPNISIPGYGSLELKAGKKKQSVNFYNPEENTCFFRISLVLEADDAGADKAAGSEDTVLWSSELLEPGESVKSIKLERALQSGEYAAIIKYECFSLSDNTTLNGANISVTLEVR
jgi:hypothetical protein